MGARGDAGHASGDTSWALLRAATCLGVRSKGLTWYGTWRQVNSMTVFFVWTYAYTILTHLTLDVTGRRSRFLFIKRSGSALEPVERIGHITAGTCAEILCTAVLTAYSTWCTHHSVTLHLVCRMVSAAERIYVLSKHSPPQCCR
jgi:hypothetical protein